MQEADYVDVLALLARWNMAPRPDLVNAERSSVEISHAFVALDGDRIVGTASYLVLDRDVAETASLAVDPACKGTGIGYRLQMARVEEIRRRGFKTLRTETDRPETIAWYIEKFGYRKVGVNPKKHEFSLPDVDHWTVLELDLETLPV
jgi:N-acetylglutamate synthase-like GNAT family acetyltransferase